MFSDPTDDPCFATGVENNYPGVSRVSVAGGALAVEYQGTVTFYAPGHWIDALAAGPLDEV